MNNHCDECGAYLEGQQPVFCSSCGIQLKLPADHSEPPPAERRQSDAGQVPVSIQEAAPVLPVSLEIDDSHFYMEGRVGILDLRFTNTTHLPIQSVVLSAQGAHVAGLRDCELTLAPGQRRRQRIQILPQKAGEHLIEIVLRVETAGYMIALTADPTLRVLEPNEKPSKMTFVIDQRMQAGRNIGYGMSVRNEVAEGVTRGIIKSTNDLLAQRFPENWLPLPLTEDSELTREFRAGGPRFVWVMEKFADLPPADALPTKIQLTSGENNVLLLGDSQIRMGRTRSENDIVLRVLPRSPENDQKSLHISGRSHVVLSLTSGGLTLTTPPEANEVHVDGQPVLQTMTLALNRASYVSVAGVLQLNVTPFAEPSSLEEDALRYRSLGKPDDAWRLADGLGIRSVLIERINALTTEKYLVIYRWAEIGHYGCELSLAGIAPGPTARLVRTGRKFWIVGRNESTSLRADDVVVPMGAAVPLLANLTLKSGTALLTAHDAKRSES